MLKDLTGRQVWTILKPEHKQFQHRTLCVGLVSEICCFDILSNHDMQGMKLSPATSKIQAAGQDGPVHWQVISFIWITWVSSLPNHFRRVSISLNGRNECAQRLGLILSFFSQSFFFFFTNHMSPKHCDTRRLFFSKQLKWIFFKPVSASETYV